MEFENLDLRRFLSADDEVSARGLEALAPRMRAFLHGRLRNILESYADREDAVEEAILKVWKARKQFTPTSEGAWWRYVATVGRNSALDIVRARGIEFVNLPPEMDIPSDDLPIFNVIVNLIERETLYELADELWLGVPADLSPAERSARLLAAQLFYLEGMTWQEVCSLVGPYVKVERGDLDAWLSSPFVLLTMAFSRLYESNESLWDLLDESLQARPWSPEERKALELRYRFARLTEQISRQTEIGAKSLEKLFQESAAHLPFPARAEFFRSMFHKRGLDAKLLALDGLWRRIAFQYHAADELPHKHILERAAQAASCVSFTLTAAMLNAWLSNGRLFSQLAAYAKGDS